MALVIKNLPGNAGDIRDADSIPEWEDPLEKGMAKEKGMATHSSILAWRSHGQKSLEGYSPWGSTESDMTEVT